MKDLKDQVGGISWKLGKGDTDFKEETGGAETDKVVMYYFSYCNFYITSNYSLLNFIKALGSKIFNEARQQQ